MFSKLHLNVIVQPAVVEDFSYLRCTLITAFDNVTMIFVNNAIKSKYNNYGFGGGAMFLIKSDFIINNSVIRFLNNSAKGVAHGGAIYQTLSIIYTSVSIVLLVLLIIQLRL